MTLSNFKKTDSKEYDENKKPEEERSSVVKESKV